MTRSLQQVARIWRVYMLSELCDNFGVVSIDGYQGGNPTYVGAKEAYAYMLTELKEAADILATAAGSDNGETNKLDRAYGYNTAKWRAYANSMRMRLAMRLSEVDPTTAKTHFEEVLPQGGSPLQATASRSRRRTAGTT